MADQIQNYNSVSGWAIGILRGYSPVQIRFIATQTTRGTHDEIWILDVTRAQIPLLCNDLHRGRVSFCVKLQAVSWFQMILRLITVLFLYPQGDKRENASPNMLCNHLRPILCVIEIFSIYLARTYFKQHFINLLYETRHTYSNFQLKPTERRVSSAETSGKIP